MLSANEIRSKFIDFFVRHDHKHVPSSPVVPPDDPTMLFTSAGMVQFKSLYSGQAPLPYPRATTVQKCLRAGGKGSDLENVGVTLRHHTFFEMLGNFSFGDYFKQEAIIWAWDFCSSPEWLGLDPKRIWPTIFGIQQPDGNWNKDDEAEHIWLTETGIVNPVHCLDEKENFWGPAGETGACGPCSELLYFMGSEDELLQYRQWAGSGKAAERGKIQEAILSQGDLFLEIWNLVFPQFDQQPDGSRLPLKNRGIDTGAGLERVTTCVQFQESQGKINTPYETDLLQPIVQAVSSIACLPYPVVAGDEKAEQKIREKGLDPAIVRLSMNACTDHARALTFTLAEGIAPSNEDRGYVLRRILRRAARFGKKMGLADPFLYRLVDPILDVMGEAYPELKKHPDMIRKTIHNEEERFTRTLNLGSERLDELLSGMSQGDVFPGVEAYRLCDTWGFPVDLTVEAAEEKGIRVDMREYEECLAEGRARARASWKIGGHGVQWTELLKTVEPRTEFTGYEKTSGIGKVISLIHKGAVVSRLEEGHEVVLITDATPFYSESGGQIGDRGIISDRENNPVFRVENTLKSDSGHVLHAGEALGSIETGQDLELVVDAERRRDTVANHSSVHLMQAALKELVGEHVTQQGSWVGPEGMRFDFTNPEPVSPDMLKTIEGRVNSFIRDSLPVRIEEMSLDDARKTGAIAPFGEKYGAHVRVVSMGESGNPVSVEFCGGTHVGDTSQLGLFIITGESSVASGIRRIEGRAGQAAFNHVRTERSILHSLSDRLSANPEGLIDRIDRLQQEIKNTRRELQKVQADQARSRMAQAAESAEEVDGIRLVVQKLETGNHQTLAEAWDALKNKSGSSTLGAFCSVVDGKVNLVIGATEDIAPSRIKAGDVLKSFAEKVGGKGGGKPTLARGGGNQPEKLAEAMDSLPEIVRECLG
jgi:alanyl-tRNA synthetase